MSAADNAGWNVDGRPDPRSDPDLGPLHVGGFSRCVFPFRDRRIALGLVMMHLYRRLSAIEPALNRWVRVMRHPVAVRWIARLAVSVAARRRRVVFSMESIICASLCGYRTRSLRHRGLYRHRRPVAMPEQRSDVRRRIRRLRRRPVQSACVCPLFGAEALPLTKC
jgi:hypothetical protein